MPQKAQRLDGQCLVDTKPENVLLAKDGRVVLTDFGIARAVEQPEAEGGQAGLLGTDQAFSFSRRDRLSGSARYLSVDRLGWPGTRDIAYEWCDTDG